MLFLQSAYLGFKFHPRAFQFGRKLRRPQVSLGEVSGEGTLMRWTLKCVKVVKESFTTLTRAILEGKHCSLPGATEFLIHMSPLGKA